MHLIGFQLRASKKERMSLKMLKAVYSASEWQYTVAGEVWVPQYRVVFTSSEVGTKRLIHGFQKQTHFWVSFVAPWWKRDLSKTAKLPVFKSVYPHLWSWTLSNDWNNTFPRTSGRDDVFAKSSRCDTSRRSTQVWNLLSPECHATFLNQNRRQKVFNRGLYVFSGGFYILKYDKNSTDLLCLIIPFKGACSFVWGAKSPKPPMATRLLWIERSQLRWFGHMSRISPERLARQVLLATTTGKQLRGRWRPWWHDYISDLAWSSLGVDRGELSDIAVDHEVFRVHLGLLPPRPSPKEKWVWKWMSMDIETFYL